jgi:hypothetical protein
VRRLFAFHARQGRPEALLHHSDRGSQGGFKESSHHPDAGDCDEHSKAPLGSI